MKVTMRRSVNGSPNGITVRNYEGGETYDSEDGYITERLCKVFVGANLADEVSPAEPDEQKITEPQETKTGPPPEPKRSLDDKIAALLTKAGFDTPEKIAAASDKELLAITGFGPASLRETRQAFQAK